MCRRGEPRKTWSVQRGWEQNGDSYSSESRSGITEAFPVHIITHAVRGRVAGGVGWGGSSPHSNYQTIKMTIASQLHFLQASRANFSQVSHVHLDRPLIILESFLIFTCLLIFPSLRQAPELIILLYISHLCPSLSFQLCPPLPSLPASSSLDTAPSEQSTEFSHRCRRDNRARPSTQHQN